MNSLLDVVEALKQLNKTFPNRNNPEYREHDGTFDFGDYQVDVDCWLKKFEAVLVSAEALKTQAKTLSELLEIYEIYDYDDIESDLVQQSKKKWVPLGKETKQK